MVETMLIDTLTDHNIFEESDSESVVSEIYDLETRLDQKSIPDEPLDHPDPPTLPSPHLSTLTSPNPHHPFPDPFLMDLPPTPPKFVIQPNLKPWLD